MSEIETIEEKPVTLTDVKMLLEKIEKRDKELNEKAKKTVEYVNKINKKTEKDIKEVRSKLDKLDMIRLKGRHIVKIMDIMPYDADSLKALFSSEPITLKQEDIQKILECLK